jgi:hypothetical protein
MEVDDQTNIFAVAPLSGQSNLAGGSLSGYWQFWALYIGWQTFAFFYSSSLSMGKKYSMKCTWNLKIKLRFLNDLRKLSVGIINSYRCTTVHYNENPIYVFLEKELRRRSPNFHIHVYVSYMGPTIFLPNIHTVCGNI